MRIAVCMPVKSGVHQFAFGAMLAMWSTSIRAGLTMAHVQTDRSPVASARNDLVRKALSIKPDHILFVDSDMVFPPDALLRLLKHDRSVVATAYPMRIPPYESTFAPVDPNCDRFGLQRAKCFGFGMVLIKPAVFEELSAPWFTHQWRVQSAVAPDNIDGEVSEDVGFCQRAMAAGIELWADLDLSYEMGHITDNIVMVPRPEALQAAAE